MQGPKLIAANQRNKRTMLLRSSGKGKKDKKEKSRPVFEYFKYEEAPAGEEAPVEEAPAKEEAPAEEAPARCKRMRYTPIDTCP